MLALCQKRARDLDEAAQLAEPSCSPHRTPLGGVADSPANKRSRQHAAASSSPWATTQASPFGCGTAAAGHVHGEPAPLTETTHPRSAHPHARPHHNPGNLGDCASIHPPPIPPRSPPRPLYHFLQCVTSVGCAHVLRPSPCAQALPLR